jgi:hypothetical protein
MLGIMEAPLRLFSLVRPRARFDLLPARARARFDSLGLVCLLVTMGAGCRSDPTHTPPPPPLPVAPQTPPTPTPEPTSNKEQPALPVAAGSEADAEQDSLKAGVPEKGTPSASAKQHGYTGTTKSGASLYDLVKRGEATMPTPPATAPAPSKPQAAPSAPAPAPASPPVALAPSAPKGKVSIPSTANLRVDIPAGLQAALDADPRMQPWANKVIQVIDSCYAQERKSNASSEGVIAVRLTMHSESRPDADIKSLPPALSGVVACATGGLMRTKMPLFTGKEGELHNVNIRFTR